MSLRNVLGAVVAVLVAALAHSWGLWTAPFLTDDYVLLDSTRGAAFPELVDPARTTFGWWRPWSRELHVGTLQRLGASATTFRVANLILLAIAAGLAVILARRLIGGPRAGLAIAGWIGGAWIGVLAGWPSAAQDAWLLVFGLAFVLAWVARGPGPLAGLAFAGALLSKESAIALVPIAAAWDAIVERYRVPPMLKRMALLLAILAAWWAVHPTIRGGDTTPLRFDLDSIPRLLAYLLQIAPTRGPVEWLRMILVAGATLLAAGAVIGASRADRWPPAPAAVERRRIAAFAATWGLIALLSVGFASRVQPYQVAFAAFGAWLALAAIVPPRAAAVVVAAGVLLGAHQNARTVTGWGATGHLRSTARLVRAAHDDLLRRMPSPPPGTRFAFAHVPHRVPTACPPAAADSLDRELSDRLLWAAGPTLRTWYRDSSLSARFECESGFTRGAGTELVLRWNPAGRWEERARSVR